MTSYFHKEKPMLERTQQNTELTAIKRLERWSLFSGILIWTGVIVFGIALLVMLRNQRDERLAYASLMTNTPTPAETTTATPTLTPTPPRYPAGWSTATPTPVGQLPTRVLENDKQTSDAADSSQKSTTDRTDSSSKDTDSTADTVPPGPRLPMTPKPPPPPAVPPDRLVIPRIELDSPIVPIGWATVQQDGINTRVWEVADYTVGWHETSSLPGRAGNIVLNGHHNIKGQIFRYLVDLEPGDPVYIYAQDQEYTFAVTEKHILKEKGEPLDVRRENAKWIEPTDDERLTMITCWPYTNNTHRLVVVAKPVPTRSLEGLYE